MNPLAQLFSGLIESIIAQSPDQEDKVIEMVECNGVWVKKDTNQDPSH